MRYLRICDSGEGRKRERGRGEREGGRGECEKGEGMKEGKGTRRKIERMKQMNKIGKHLSEKMWTSALLIY